MSKTYRKYYGSWPVRLANEDFDRETKNNRYERYTDEYNQYEDTWQRRIDRENNYTPPTFK